MRTTWKMILSAPVLASGVLVLAAVPAQAGWKVPATPPTQTTQPTQSTQSTQSTSTSTGATDDSGGTRVGSAGNCSVVSSPSFLGLSCGDGSTTTASVKQVLGNDAVPGCWDDRLTDAELNALSYQNGESTWYWHRCLKGINLKTKEVGPNGVSFTVELRGVKPGEKVVSLTKNQQTLVNMYSTEGTIPSPVAGVSPSATPRVGSWVSFFDGTDSQVTVQAGAVVLRAHVASITVEPLGKGKQPALTCNGIGYKAKRGDTKANHPAGCWHKYVASSADQTDNVYPVNITAHWVVDVSSGAGFTRFDAFDKSQVTNIPVTEVEALVVP